MKKLWGKICLLFFHLWYGWDAYRIKLAGNYFKKNEVWTANDGIMLIILTNENRVGCLYEYIVKPYAPNRQD